jgi:hypothetical protein
LHPARDGEQIVGLAAAIVETAGRGADAAEIERDRRQPRLAQRALDDRDDLVVHRAAMLRMRMADDRRAAARAFCFGTAAYASSAPAGPASTMFAAAAERGG